LGSDPLNRAFGGGTYGEASQIGDHNNARLEQQGFAQYGAYNALLLWQWGDYNVAHVTQVGGNFGTVTQIGSRNFAEVVHNQDYQHANVVQIGNGLSTKVTLH